MSKKAQAIKICKMICENSKNNNLILDGEIAILDSDYTLLGTLIMSKSDIFFVDVYGIEIELDGSEEEES